MFGDKLYEALKMRHMQQKDLAKAVGTSDVSISRYISNERNPKITTAIKIANVLNVSLDWLCENKQIAKADGIKLYQQGWNDAIDAMQNAKFVSVADRKTENSSEKPNNYCDDCLYTDTCDSKELFYACTSKATISKMEQVDKPERNMAEDIVKSFGFKAESYRQAKAKTEPQAEIKGSKKLLKGSDEPQADCGDFADRLAYERGVKHAWEVAQKVFNSTVTFYKAEDVAKQVDKDINVRSKEPQTCSVNGRAYTDCCNCEYHKCTADELQTDCPRK